jgi:hypothetical protein
MNKSIQIALFSALILTALPSNGENCNPSITPSTPTDQFTKNGDGTVTDKKTALTWMRCSLGQTWNAGCTGDASVHNWRGALKAGKGDWRLPNIKELKSITEQACYSPAINANIFPDTQEGSYWSSSPDAQQHTYAWYVYFGHGAVLNEVMSDNYYVRLVRGGQ